MESGRGGSFRGERGRQYRGTNGFGVKYPANFVRLELWLRAAVRDTHGEATVHAELLG